MVKALADIERRRIAAKRALSAAQAESDRAQKVLWDLQREEEGVIQEALGMAKTLAQKDADNCIVNIRVGDLGKGLGPIAEKILSEKQGVLLSAGDIKASYIKPQGRG